MSKILCKFVCKDEEFGEVTVGCANVQFVPRAGESVWITNDRKGASFWKVEEVSYWLADCEHDVTLTVISE